MDNFTETKLGKFKWEVVRGYAETRETKSLVAYPTAIEECLELIEVCKKKGLSICPRGNGYTYGDMILNDGQVILDLSHMDHILSWNEDQGVIIVQPGARFSDIFSKVLPYNWSLSSCPGGMGITIGGAVSNNVHGKDSWKNGNFGSQVVSLKLVTSTGDILTVDRDKNPNILKAVIGGMGLLGIIVEITLQMKKVPSAFVGVSTISVRNIEESIERIEQAREDSDFIVSWIDAFASGSSLGRGYVTFAKWVDNKISLDNKRLLESLRMSTRIFNILPSKPTWYVLRPFFNPASIQIVNSFNYFLSKIKGLKKNTMLYTEYNFMHNRIPDLKYVYRPHGFLEFQPLIPRKNGVHAVAEVFRLCQKYETQSLLCGVKKHKEDDYMLSYSGDSYSIGIDIQLRGRSPEQINRFAKALFKYTLECGGKTFLAKDETLPRDIFERMFPRYKEFLEVKKSVDPFNLFKSDMYRRLLQPACEFTN